VERKRYGLPGEVCQQPLEKKIDGQPNMKILAELAEVSRGHSTYRKAFCEEGPNILSKDELQ